jgi:peptide/nickel transport system substrate-binding protein
MLHLSHSLGARLVSLALSLLLLFSLGATAAAEDAQKVVNIGVTSTLGSLNPLLLDAGELNKYAQGLQFLPLFDLDKDLNVVGMLGESFETSDNITYTVKLNPAATWSDGVPVTADDVVFTVLKLTNKAVGNLTMAGYAALAGFDEYGNSPDGATEIEGVTKVDDKTLRFVFKAQTSPATFINSFARYLLTIPKHKLETVADADLPTTDWFGHADAVSGPYIVTDFDSNHYVSYAANPAYFRGAPKIGKLNIKIVEGSQLYAGLKSGEIDFVQPTTGAIPQEDQAGVEALSGITSVREKPLTSQPVFINTAKLPDVRVRQAILYAIDRNLLLGGLLEGRGEVVDGFLSSLSPFYDAAITPIAYDPAKAKALLAEAGWDGSQKLSFVVDSGDSTFVQGASVIAAQLAEVGITAEIRTVDFASIWDYVFAGDFDMFSVQYTLTPIDPYPDISWLLGAGNFLAYANDEVSRLLTQIGAAEGNDATRAIYSRINQIVQAEVPMFNAYVTAPLGAVSNRLTNAEPHVYGSFNHVELWDVAQ